MTWDEYYHKIAKVVGSNSKCFARHIGVIIVRDKQIISTGYNGNAAGIPDCSRRNPNNDKSCPRRLMGFKSGEGMEYCTAVHGEANAIVQAAKHGVSVKGATMYCDCNTPCIECCKLIINAGITEVVIVEFRENNPNPSTPKSMDMFNEAGVKVRLYDYLCEEN